MEASIYAVLVVASSLRETDVHADDEIVGVEYPCLGYEACVDCQETPCLQVGSLGVSWGLETQLFAWLS